jgi:hypothetical protein
MRYLYALLSCLSIGCGVFDKYDKDSEGYYPRYNWSCGPLALQKAIGINSNQVSREIQDYDSVSKQMLSLFDKRAILITWPSEIKKICEKYGYKVIRLHDISQLDFEKDLAIILVHKKFKMNSYHWIVYPNEDVKYHLDKTVVDIIFLLKKR